MQVLAWENEVGKYCVDNGYLSLAQLQVLQKKRLQQNQNKNLLELIAHALRWNAEQMKFVYEKALSNQNSDHMSPSKLIIEAMPDIVKALEPGKKTENFGRYQIIRKIGQGGMGEVYHAYDPELKRHLALKTILKSNQEIFVKRFMKEAEATARLSHPHIVRVYDFGKEQKTYYFTMDFIEGKNLSQHIKEDKISTRKALEIMHKVVKAMAYAHSQGIIHRDLKPANIMMDKEFNPRIMDFGLAREIESEAELSQSGDIIGTPAFMPPEQASGQKNVVDERSDVYSLGAVLYQLLTGCALFKGTTAIEIIIQVLEREPIAPRQHSPKLAIDLETICMKAIEKEPSRRYQSAEDMAQDIENYLNGEVILARPSSFWYRYWRKLVKNKLITAVVLGALVLVSITFFNAQRTIQIARQKSLQQKQAKIAQTLGEAEGFLKTAVTAQALRKKYPPGPYIITLEDKERSAILEKYGEIREKLDQILALAPNNKKIKKYLAQIEKEIGLLALDSHNYILSYLSFKRCANLGGDPGKKLLALVATKKTEIANNQIARIKEIMKTIETKLPEEGIINEYITEIVRMQGDHVLSLLIRYLNNSKNLWQRRVAIEALGKIGDNQTAIEGKDTVEHLLARLKQVGLKKEQEASVLIWALGRLKDPRSEKLVAQMREKSGKHSYLWTNTKIPYSWIPTGEKQPQTAQQWLQRGRKRRDKGDYLEAVADFTKAIELDSDFAKAYYYRGDCWEKYGNYIKAKKDLRKAIALNPNTANPYNVLGIILFKQGNYDQAITYHNKAIKLDTKFYQAYHNRGNAYACKKQLKKAIQDYQKAVAINPKFDQGYLNQGLVLYELNNFRGAIAYFDKAIALSPKSAITYLSRGNAYAVIKDINKALADYNYAIFLNPRFYQAYTARGELSRKRSLIEEAYEDFTQAIHINPKYAHVYKQRALLLNHQKKHQKSAKDLKAYLKLNPQDPQAANMRKYIKTHK